MSQIPPPPPSPAASPTPAPSAPPAAPAWPAQTGTGAPIASPSRRFVGQVLELLLMFITFFLGWLVWSFFEWRNGLTPAKRVLGMRVVKEGTRENATFGTMALREVVGKWLIFLVLLPTVIIPTVLCFMLCWDKKRQELWDKLASTVVVDDLEME